MQKKSDIRKIKFFNIVLLIQKKKKSDVRKMTNLYINFINQ